jgi:hypothetical protein
MGPHSTHYCITVLHCSLDGQGCKKCTTAPDKRALIWWVTFLRQVVCYIGLDYETSSELR